MLVIARAFGQYFYYWVLDAVGYQSHCKRRILHGCNPGCRPGCYITEGLTHHLTLVLALLEAAAMISARRLHRRRIPYRPGIRHDIEGLRFGADAVMRRSMMPPIPPNIPLPASQLP